LGVRRHRAGDRADRCRVPAARLTRSWPDAQDARSPPQGFANCSSRSTAPMQESWSDGSRLSRRVETPRSHSRRRSCAGVPRGKVRALCQRPGHPGDRRVDPGPDGDADDRGIGDDADHSPAAGHQGRGTRRPAATRPTRGTGPVEDTAGSVARHATRSITSGGRAIPGSPRTMLVGPPPPGGIPVGVRQGQEAP